jgi:hypothetical protein
MTIPSDVFENASNELSAVISAVLDDEDVAQPANLASVREAVLGRVKTATVPLNRFASDELQQLRDEIDALIEEFGEDAQAVRFLKPWASEPLGRLIEAGLDQEGRFTLGALFEAAERGLLANLISQGEIDDDEAQTVIGELQLLIDRHGADALAEEFVREP